MPASTALMTECTGSFRVAISGTWYTFGSVLPVLSDDFYEATSTTTPTTPTTITSISLHSFQGVVKSMFSMLRSERMKFYRQVPIVRKNSLEQTQQALVSLPNPYKERVQECTEWIDGGKTRHACII
jgi:hypothetical protein